jgi:hypothetical protein
MMTSQTLSLTMYRVRKMLSHYDCFPLLSFGSIFQTISDRESSLPLSNPMPSSLS